MTKNGLALAAMITEAVLQRCSWERCSEGMQQIYKRTPMPKCRAHVVRFVKVRFYRGVMSTEMVSEMLSFLLNFGE